MSGAGGVGLCILMRASHMACLSPQFHTSSFCVSLEALAHWEEASSANVVPAGLYLREPTSTAPALVCLSV